MRCVLNTYTITCIENDLCDFSTNGEEYIGPSEKYSAITQIVI